MGGKTTKSSQEVTIPPEVLARYNAVNARAETVAERPYQIYSTDPSKFVAPLTDPQRAGISQTMQSAQQAQPFFQAATGQLLGAQGSAQPLLTQAQGMAQASARDVNPGELQTQQFMSPYIGNVVEAQRALTQRQQEAQMSGAMGQAIRSGAYGGDRAGIAAANLAREQQLAQAGILSPLLQQGYTQALQTAQQQQGLGLSAEQANRATQAQAAQLISGLGAQQFGMGAQTAQQLAGLGQGAQGASLQGAQAQMGAGQMAQQTEQAGLQALYNQFLQEQSYPFQVAQFLANIAMGTGALSGSTTTTRQPGGYFSDSRLKEDIEEVGTLHDGQPIFKFRYKGEPREATKIGLMADEVEHDKPEAVGLAGGYRTVNYDEATKDAASMGGGVMPRHAGEPFARGGYADGGSPLLPGLGGGDLGALLQAQARMYSPYSSQGPYMGASSPAYGGGAYVPQANLPVSALATPTGPMPEQPDVIGNMNKIAEAGKNLGEAYEKGVEKGWWGGKDDSSTAAMVTPAQETVTRTVEGADTIRNRMRAGLPMRARGGLVQQGLFDDTPERAMGGGLGAMPFSGGTGQGLSIPQQAGDEQLSLGRAAGGGINPYGPQGLNIPSEIEKPEPLKPAEAPTPRSGMDDVAALASTAASIASMMSDRRAKTDIAPVGKLNNGEEVYRYRLKGDPRMQIGLMADEVEERHPEAVGLAGGMKTLDYETATDDAVKRASGGLVPLEPGDFMYEHQHLLGRPQLRDLTAKYGPADGLRIAREQHEGRRGYQTAGSVISAEDQMAERAGREAFAGGFPYQLRPASELGPSVDPRSRVPRIADFMLAPKPEPEKPVREVPFAFPAGTGEYPGVNTTYLYTGRPAGGPGGAPARPPGLGSGPPTAKPPLSTSDSLGLTVAGMQAQRLPTIPVDATYPGLSGAEQQAALSARQRPAGMSSTGTTAQELQDYRPPRTLGILPTTPATLRGTPTRTEAFLNRYGLDKAENVIPLLTGIAAMGTAPTRSLGVALASGVGAGAQAYLPTRQAIAETEQTRAQTGRTAAETAGVEAQTLESQARTLAQLQNVLAPPGYVPVPDPKGKFEFAGIKYSLRLKARGIEESESATAAAPANQYSLVSPDTAAYIERRFPSYNQSDRAANERQFADIEMATVDASAQYATNLKYALTFSKLGKDSRLDPGAFNPLISNVVTYINDGLARMGIVDDSGQPLALAAGDVTNAQVIDKLAEQVARQGAATAGGDNLQSLLIKLKVLPGRGTDRQAGLNLLATMLVDQQRQIDSGAYVRQFGEQVGRFDPTMARQFPVSEAESARIRDPRFTPFAYNKEIELLQNYLSDDAKFASIARRLADPRTAEAMKASLAKATGNAIFYRYFTGTL